MSDIKRAFEFFLKEISSFEHGGMPALDKKRYADTIKKVAKTLNDGRKILLYGDYDVDGVVSVLMMDMALRRIVKNIYGKNPDDFINKMVSNRDDGFGMTEDLFNRLSQRYDLVITLDTGTSLDFMSKNNEKVVVIDHHPEECTDIKYIVNPNIDNPNPVLTSNGRIVYDFLKNLSRFYENAIGRTFLTDKTNKTIKELAAITLLSDMAVLDKKNRKFIKEALKTISEDPILPIYYLLDDLNNVTSTDISFSIISKINGYSRMGRDMNDIFDWIVPKTPRAWEEVNKKVEKTHKEKMALVRSMFLSFDEEMKNRCVENGFCHLFLKDNDFHGINGLIANKLFQMMGVPAFVMSNFNDNEVVGSARGYNVKSILSKVYEALSPDPNKNTFGGHEEACGFRLEKRFVNRFSEELKIFSDSLKEAKTDNVFLSEEPISLKEFLELQEIYKRYSEGVDFHIRPFQGVKDFNVEYIKKFKSGYAKVIVSDKIDPVARTSFFIDANVNNLDLLKDGTLVLSFSPKSPSFHTLTKDYKSLVNRAKEVVVQKNRKEQKTKKALIHSF